MKYSAIAGRIMDKLVTTHEGAGEIDHLTLDTWEWPQGVAVYSMMKVYQANKDPEIIKQLESWYEKHFLKGLPSRNINTTAPMLALTLLYEETGNPDYGTRITDWAEWVMHGLAKTDEDGFQHITSCDINNQQLWDDTLFMTVLFLYRAGIAMHRKDWCDTAKYQFLLHIKYLHDTKTGLWYHGFTFEGRHHFGEAFWARGNGWFTAGAVDFIEWLHDNHEDASVIMLIENTWKEQCAALRNLQDDKTGLWHTLLDHADSYTETSASSAIAYGMLKGVRLGLLDNSYTDCAEKALSGVLKMVDDDGTVQGVSYGTPMGNDLDFYRNIPVCPTAYGQGLAFLMLTEKIRNEQQGG